MDGDIRTGTVTQVLAPAAWSEDDWRRVSVGVYRSTAGVFPTPGSPHHKLGVHLGPPVNVSCRCREQVANGPRRHGDTDLIPAGIDGVWIDEAPASFLRLGLSHRLLRETAGEMDLDPDRIALTPRLQLRDPQVQHIAWALKAEAETGETGGRLYAESLSVALSAHLVRRYAEPLPTPRPQQGLSERQRRRVLDYIDAHLDEDLSLARLAEIAGVSVSHFKPLFRRTVGAPPHQYVIQRRVDRARLLLANGHASISEAAFEAGFTHPSHMARWMRRLLGVTPAALVRHGA
ncbi:helix-turn-helix domain-containing protein [Phenylobacterium montanum]|uniref:Helix-turn-helix transcriptional regulator n=1 Tax=Phenylobacterium montanum TaxID=2823693 RepID=A0A975G352_9CAUL|nr:AraC family transcriptional regulator [Caulobacter sp. S6]QUD89929.1 helix-turn-helix transcriptional regulator [Caulobacter sp. S6]